MSQVFLFDDFAGIGNLQALTAHNPLFRMAYNTRPADPIVGNVTQHVVTLAGYSQKVGAYNVSPPSPDYEVTVRIEPQNQGWATASQAGVMLRASGEGATFSGYQVVAWPRWSGAPGNQRIEIYKWINGGRSVVHNSGDYATGDFMRPVTLRVVAEVDTLTVFLDGSETAWTTYTDPSPIMDAGQPGLSLYDHTYDYCLAIKWIEARSSSRRRSPLLLTPW